MSDKEEVPAFTLPGAGGGFANRTQDVFGNLQVLEKKHLAYQQHRESTGELEKDEKLWKTDPDEDVKKAYNLPVQDEKEPYMDPAPKRRRPNDYRSPGDRGDFKLPAIPQPRKFGRHTPDFKKHPEKWTKYSLEDVDARDMSERSNTQAALAFLAERRRLREGIVEEERDEAKLNEGACSKRMISFTKPVRSAGKDDDPEREVLFRKPKRKPDSKSSISSKSGEADLSPVDAGKSAHTSAVAASQGSEGDADDGDEGLALEGKQATADDDGDVDMSTARGEGQGEAAQEKAEESQASAPAAFKGRKSQKRSIRMRYYEEEEEEEEEEDEGD